MTETKSVASIGSYFGCRDLRLASASMLCKQRGFRLILGRTVVIVVFIEAVRYCDIPTWTAVSARVDGADFGWSRPMVTSDHLVGRYMVSQ